MAVTLSDTARNTMLDALTALLNNGSVQFRTSGDVAVATCPLGASAFNAAASGSADIDDVSNDTDAVGGTIAKVVLRNSGGTVVVTMSVTVTSGGGDMTGASVVVAAHETVSITGLTLTQPAS